MKNIKRLAFAGVLSASLILGNPVLASAESNIIKDGKYDNHNSYVDESKYSITDITESVEMITRTINLKVTYEDLEGNVKSVYGQIGGTGSSVVIKKEDGYAYVLTNAHVINSPIQMGYIVPGLPSQILEKSIKIEKISEEYSIQKGGKNHSLEVIFSDSELDAALLRVKDSDDLNAFPYKIGNSDKMDLGDFIYAVGFPLGFLDDYVLDGNVSKLNIKDVKTDVFGRPYFVDDNDRFMMNTPLISGNSGGPIVAIMDGEYELIGLASAVMARNDYDITKGGYVPDFYGGHSVAIKINPIMEKVDAYFAELAEQKAAEELKKDVKALEQAHEHMTFRPRP